jgi:hypothetical protein
MMTRITHLNRSSLPQQLQLTHRRCKHLVAAALSFLLAGTLAAAQQPTHSISAGVAYTDIRTNVLPGCSCVSLQGGGAQLEYIAASHLALVADFTATHKGGITPDGYSLTQLTYTVGARGFATRKGARVRPFGEIKLGLATALGSLSPTSTGYGSHSSAFALEPGGGVQVRLSSHFTLLPVQADYLLTTFSNGQNNRQNQLVLSAGILYRFKR